MREHTWQIEELVCSIDTSYFWLCRVCGSSGGPAPTPDKRTETSKPLWTPFLAGTPIIGVSDDCDRAKKSIDDYIEKYPEWIGHRDRARMAESKI